MIQNQWLNELTESAMLTLNLPLTSEKFFTSKVSVGRLVILVWLGEASVLDYLDSRKFNHCQGLLALSTCHLIFMAMEIFSRTKSPGTARNYPQYRLQCNMRC